QLAGGVRQQQALRLPGAAGRLRQLLPAVLAELVGEVVVELRHRGRVARDGAQLTVEEELTGVGASRQPRGALARHPATRALPRDGRVDLFRERLELLQLRRRELPL